MIASARHKRDAFFAALASGPQIMGIVNVTPDSFSDGGRFLAADAALAEARRHVAGGAAIVDVGAESTRPGYASVAEADELARLAPLLASVIGALEVAVSIDTTKAAVARVALKTGAALVNDQWGLQGDPGMAAVVAESEAGLVLMHNRAGIDADDDIIDAMRRFFDFSLAIADAAGIARDRILLDPGVGFGKSKAQNIAALGTGVAALRETYGLPVLVGCSRKSLFAALIGATRVEDRLVGTLAANLAAVAQGAGVLRVHDCAEHRDALAVFRAILGTEPRAGSDAAQLRNDGAESEWTAIGLGLGGNLGDPAATIARSLEVLRARGHVRIDAMSSLYRTAPWGPVAQPDFANACALGTTDLAPRALLAEIKAVEAELGRVAGERWGPRIVDIDILFYAGASVDVPDLVIPHKSLFERAFVLVPLAEIAPDLVIAGRRVGDAVETVDRSGVTLWQGAVRP